MLRVLLEGATAIFALTAAAFWFWSAAHPLPPELTYIGGAPASDPFYAALQEGTALNRFAALFAGLSAGCAGAATVTGWLSRANDR
jgi:hypothetical protein